MITNYNELKDAWAAWMHRDNLDDVFDTVAAVIISRLSRDLRVQENETETLLITPNINDGVSLPADFREVREVTASFQGQQRPLSYLSPVQFSTQGIQGGRPRVYTIRKGFIFTKGAGEIQLTYWRSVEDIVTTGNSPTLLTYPDLYLYAGLAELQRYVQDETLAVAFTQYYKTELNIVNNVAQASRVGNRPVMRAS